MENKYYPAYPPPNYASVILEINSQRTHHQSSSCAQSTSAGGASSLMNPIMVPPPAYDEVQCLAQPVAPTPPSWE